MVQWDNTPQTTQMLCTNTYKACDTTGYAYDTRVFGKHRAHKTAKVIIIHTTMRHDTRRVEGLGYKLHMVFFPATWDFLLAYKKRPLFWKLWSTTMEQSTEGDNIPFRNINDLTHVKLYWKNWETTTTISTTWTGSVFLKISYTAWGKPQQSLAVSILQNAMLQFSAQAMRVRKLYVCELSARSVIWDCALLLTRTPSKTEMLIYQPRAGHRNYKPSCYLSM